MMRWLAWWTSREQWMLFILTLIRLMTLFPTVYLHRKIDEALRLPRPVFRTDGCPELQSWLQGLLISTLLLDNILNCGLPGGHTHRMKSWKGTRCKIQFPRQHPLTMAQHSVLCQSSASLSPLGAWGSLRGDKMPNSFRRFTPQKLLVYNCGTIVLLVHHLVFQHEDLLNGVYFFALWTVKTCKPSLFSKDVCLHNSCQYK